MTRRCTVYTRKSTDEGLDQDFNSLDAQHESCLAYIASQKNEGWQAISACYDDGGYSGGNMDRPGLQRLLTDVAEKKVDIIVVYKIDRLTRSLADFAKMVELFDAHQVSFVSVTQQFNTTTSMGRLTLNVLLSFAQFEREVTAERIRDKIAASKKNGLWMGGVVPLGYDARDKKLVINHAEAETIRTLFRLYLELGTVRRLKEAADHRGIVTKAYVQANGVRRGGKPFSRGHLYQLLRNPLYIGQVRHKEAIWPGQHEAIIDPETWEAVQDQLAAKAAPRQRGTNQTGLHLLTGLLFDETGDRLSPTHATKSGRRYRYYISKRLMHRQSDDRSGWRLPAPALEKLVIEIVCIRLRDQSQLLDWMRHKELPLATLHTCLKAASALAARLEKADGAEGRSLVLTLLHRVTLGDGSIRITVDRTGVAQAIGWPCTASEPDSTPPPTLDVPIKLRRRGVEAKLVLPSDRESKDDLDPTMVTMIARAHRWLSDMATGKASTIRELARSYHHGENDISRTLPLAFLAPDIVEAIMTGKQPVTLTAQRLRQTGTLPLDWAGQRQALGLTD